MVDSQALQELRRRILQGQSWRKAARKLSLPTTTAYEAAVARWPALRRRPRVDERERRAIVRAIDAGGSCRAVARRFGRSPDTVSRIRHQLIDQVAGPAHAKACRAYRCPTCRGLVTTRPCLLCSLQASPNIGRRDVPR